MSEEEIPVNARHNPDKNMTELDFASGSRIYDVDEIQRLTALVAADGIDVVCFVFDPQTQQWYIVTGDGESYGAVYSLKAGSLVITVLEMLIRDSKQDEGDRTEVAVVPEGPDSFVGALQFHRIDTSEIEDFIKEVGDERPPA